MKLVNEELMSAVMTYLQERPFKEVASGCLGLIQAPNTEQLYTMLATCIRTGQVPDEDVPKILASDPAFAQFYNEVQNVRQNVVSEVRITPSMIDAGAEALVGYFASEATLGDAIGNGVLGTDAAREAVKAAFAAMMAAPKD